MIDKDRNPRSAGYKSHHLERLIIVDLRINETLQPGAVRKPHLPGGASVFLFLEFTIIRFVVAQFIARSCKFYPPEKLIYTTWR